MTPRSLSLIFCGVFLAAAQGEDPFAEPQSNGKSPPEDPEEAALVEMLEKLGPRSKGMGTGANDDGRPTLCVLADETPDLSALQGLPVRNMQIMGTMDGLASGRIMDLAPLAGMPLETLWIWKVPLKDLSPLKTTRLKKLLIMGSRITDISPLKDLPLVDLNLWCTDVSDISPLKGMRLKHLNIDCSECARVEDLTPLEGMQLESLRFHANGVTKGIEIARGMKSLKEIEGKTPEEFWKDYDAAAPAREMVAKAGLKFTRLDGSADGINLWFHGDDLIDLAPLRGLPVVFLGFRESKVSDLRPLAGTPLTILCIKSSALTDLSPLSETPITNLYLDCDNLIDLSPLRKTKLHSLSLGCPKVTDLSALRKLPLKDLDIRGCGVTDLRPLEGMSMEDIQFDSERITKGWEVLRGIKALKQINSCKTEDFWNERDGKKPTDPFVK